MTRTEAINAVSSYIETIEQGGDLPPAHGIAIDTARDLLGAGIFSRLMADPIRKHGPIAGYIYPWNVIDYLDDAVIAKWKQD